MFSSNSKVHVLREKSTSHPLSGRLHAMLDTQIAFANDVLGKTDGLTEWRAIVNNKRRDYIMQLIRDLIRRISPVLSFDFQSSDHNSTSLHLIKSHNFPVYCT